MATDGDQLATEFPGHHKIGGTLVGPGEPCYVIAEAGSNHDRDLDIALRLVETAANAGADAIKFQSFSADDLAARIDVSETRLQGDFAKYGRTLWDLYNGCALPLEFHEPLAARAKELGIDFLSTPFSEAHVDNLVSLGVAAIKIASFELVHLPLIRHAASSGLPLILSTGMANLGDIERALEAADRGGATALSLLHCGSAYPLDACSANLSAMETLRRAFGVPVGYSDHTLGTTVAIAAASIGCQLYEKHFTLSRQREGPDHSFAIEPRELSAMVDGIRIAESAIGSSKKRRLAEESEPARRGRRSIFSARSLPQGHVLSVGDLKVVRPGLGIEPQYLDLVLGRQLVRSIDAELPLSWDHVLR